ncbi:alkaline phosphatase family protein [Marinomonas arenicola]|uniref:sulfatase-like hydrolase/transferase n=1 Tax=Marinomonas TaxID=28253 RepID=UPI0010548E69|nr:sulfatase-like hydrolase/transferase [Marinomonas sp. KMM3893]
MSDQNNILFIMMDQLRWDCLSCYGRSVIDTPNIDRIAAKGVRFTNAYVQGSSCGNSRASFYTGRHVRSHGATWNDWPFHVAEWTLADYLKPSDTEVVLLGKTHMKPDAEGMKRLQIDPMSAQGKALSNAGFLQGEHDDGLHPEGPLGRYSKIDPKYNQWVKKQGYEGGNAWLQWANAVEDEAGVARSGFFMKHAHLPARLPSELSETAYMTNRAIETIDKLADKPWCLHLSYIKPHWPFVVSAPYHELYQGIVLPEAIKSEKEREDPHPIYREFMKLGVANVFSDDRKRQHVMPAYLGLIKQLDDELGRLFKHLEEKGLDKNTSIVITADHGDYFGDHWLGEKDLFHDSSINIPLIIHDPSPAADATRGTVCDELTCAIDLIPTFMELVGQTPLYHRLEGRSLLPILHNKAFQAEREIIVCENDYGRLPVANALKRSAYNARMTMAYDGQYKFIHAPGFDPMLFDVKNDPKEFVDLGRDAGYAQVRYQMQEKLLDWSSILRNRVAVSEEMFVDNVGKSLRQGILPGFWSEDEVPETRKIPTSAGVF